MRPIGERRIAVLAEGGFDLLEAKTAVGVIRYGRDPVVAVADSRYTGRTAADIVGVGDDVPIVESVAAALAYKPNTLLLGTAPRGGVLPAAWRRQVVHAMREGLDIINGLHHFLEEDEELAGVARSCGVDLWDVRRVPDEHRVADTRAHQLESTVVLTVGSDCNVGKMSASLELDAAARRTGHRSAFVATGQTGIIIAGWGLAIDRVISDFAAGASEDLVMQGAEQGDIVFVEGQGSLVHPGYSGVTLSLIHGSAPDGMILCHQVTRTTIRRYTLPVPPLRDLVTLHEHATAHVKPSRVIGIALNTFGLDEAAAQQAIAAAADETGLPATDPVRYDVQPLLAAVEALHNRRKQQREKAAAG